MQAIMCTLVEYGIHHRLVHNDRMVPPVACKGVSAPTNECGGIARPKAGYCGIQSLLLVPVRQSVDKATQMRKPLRQKSFENPQIT